jgi:hypothetical protein
VADAHPGVRDDKMVETEEVAGVEDVEVAVTTRQRWSGSSRSWPPFSPCRRRWRRGGRGGSVPQIRWAR